MEIEIIGPETVFEDDAKPLRARIDELERHGASSKRIEKARKHVKKALDQIDRAYSGLR